MFNFVKRGYCNAGVSAVCLFVCLCITPLNMGGLLQNYMDIIIPTLSRNITGIGIILKSPNLWKTHNR